MVSAPLYQAKSIKTMAPLMVANNIFTVFHGLCPAERAPGYMLRMKTANKRQEMNGLMSANEAMTRAHSIPKCNIRWSGSIYTF